MVPDSSHDGYAWHLHTLAYDGRPYREYDASGNGGQLMIVLPELDIVVAFTAGNYNRYRIWRKFRDELVPKYVIGAVTR
jgi:CubicO group peptidase (beta-lactamase class C family)